MIKEEKIRHAQSTTLYLTGSKEEVTTRADEISLVYESQIVDSKSNEDGTVTLEMFCRKCDR